MRTKLFGGPKDGDEIDATWEKIGHVLVFPDIATISEHHYRVYGVHGVQHLDGTSSFTQMAKYVGHIGDPLDTQ